MTHRSLSKKLAVRSDRGYVVAPPETFSTRFFEQTETGIALGCRLCGHRSVTRHTREARGTRFGAQLSECRQKFPGNASCGSGTRDLRRAAAHDAPSSHRLRGAVPRDVWMGRT